MSFEWLGSLLAANWWAGIGALATVAAAVGIVLAVKQLRFNAWLKAQEIFVDEKFVEARGRIFRHLEPQAFTWDSDDQDAGLLVCRRLDELSRLAPYFAFRKSRGREVVLEVWAVPLGRLWGLLDPLVDAERDKVNWQTKWNAFEELGGEALRRLSPKEQHTLEQVSERLKPAIRQLRGVEPSPPAVSGGAA